MVSKQFPATYLSTHIYKTHDKPFLTKSLNIAMKNRFHWFLWFLRYKARWKRLRPFENLRIFKQNRTIKRVQQTITTNRLHICDIGLILFETIISLILFALAYRMMTKNQLLILWVWRYNLILAGCIRFSRQSVFQAFYVTLRIYIHYCIHQL